MAARKPAKSSAKSGKKTAPTKAAPKPAPAPKAASPPPAPSSAPVTAAANDPIYPIVDRTPWGIIALVLGIVGLGGVGTIIAGAVSKRHMGRDITFGILQIVVPFLGWAWGLVWGILIFVKGNK